VIENKFFLRWNNHIKMLPKILRL